MMIRKGGKKDRPPAQPLWRRFANFSAAVLTIYLGTLLAFHLRIFKWRRALPFPKYQFANATCGLCDFSDPTLVDTFRSPNEATTPAIEPTLTDPCRDYINVEAVGRLGNLMFEYATVIGICVQRGFDPATCARITAPAGVNASSDVLPLTLFKGEFQVPSVPRQCARYEPGRGVHVEHEKRVTPSTGHVDFDDYASHVPVSTTLRGYFQSYRYFYPHADQFVRKAFSFSAETSSRASSFLNNVAKKVHHSHQWKPKDYEIVCMAVRRGDKTNKKASPIYRKWALSAEYYRQAVKEMQTKHALKKLVVVVFVGGSFNSAEDKRDRIWVDGKIVRLQTTSVLFLDDAEIAAYPYASMKAISMCPNIIIGSSSFGWWGAYLSNHDSVIAPKELYSTEMNFVPWQYYPLSWKLLKEPKIALFSLRSEEKSAIAKNVLKEPDLTRLGSDLTTVVSSYYKIPSKYNHSATYEKWMSNFMTMNFKCVIFVDSVAHRELTAKWPATARRKYIVREIADFECAKGSWDWAAHEKLDPEIHVGHNALLYQLWSEKIFMVAHVVETNPFQTGTFAWTDIGAFRDPSRLASLRGYPDPSKFVNRKVTFPQIEDFTPWEAEDLESVDRRFLHKVRIGGGHFAGAGPALLQFRDLYKEILQESFNAGVFIGKDQSMFAFLILRHPFLFDTVKPSFCPGHYDIWFCIQYHWSASGTAVSGSFVPVPWSNLLLGAHSASQTSVISITKDQQQKCDAMLLILSVSCIQNNRNAVREGWISSLKTIYPSFPFRYKFILGRDESLERRFGPHGTAKYLKKEIDFYQDVEVLPFSDTYLNLTTKVALMLKWAAKTAPSCKYIFKIDEDVVLRPRAFAYFVRKILPSHGGDLVYGGHIYDQKKRVSAPSRDPANRNSLSVALFPFMFSPYAAGPMYFLSSSLVRKLPYGISRVVIPQGGAEITELVPDFYWRARGSPLYSLEDAFFGHMIYNMTDVMTVHVKNWFPIAKPKSKNQQFLALWGIKNPDQIRGLSHLPESKHVTDHKFAIVPKAGH